MIHRIGRISNCAAIAFWGLVLIPAYAQSDPEIRARGEITVERAVIDAYVLDWNGEPIPNLTTHDFRATIDGRRAEIESVEWIPAAGEQIARSEGQRTGDRREPFAHSERSSEGRVLVFFFQTDFERSRIHGQMKILDYAIRFLDSLEPTDRVAVVQFDSHLKIRHDFTADRVLLERAILESVRIDRPAPAPAESGNSLVKAIDPHEAKRAASPERALQIVADALEPIRGPKSLVVFGWGLGRFGTGGVTMTKDYEPARRSLDRARVSVFTMDITDADYHSLEVGLQQVSDDTGGFYQKTNVFPSHGLDKLRRVISGRYEIVLKVPQGLRRRRHEVEIRLPGRRWAEVLARKSF